MRLAGAADYFGSDHAVASVCYFFDYSLCNRPVKTRPTAARFKFSFMGEEGSAASFAQIGAFVKKEVVSARERTLGALLTHHAVGFFIEFFAPFALALREISHFVQNSNDFFRGRLSACSY